MVERKSVEASTRLFITQTGAQSLEDIQQELRHRGKTGLTLTPNPNTNHRGKTGLQQKSKTTLSMPHLPTSIFKEEILIQISWGQ